MAKESFSLDKFKKIDIKKKQQLLVEIEKDAHDKEVEFWGCGQAVLSALQEYLDFGNEQTFKAATALAGGVVGMREFCGALLGGILAIGLAYGRSKFEPGLINREQWESQEATVRANELCNRFTEMFGSPICRYVRLAVREPGFKDYINLNTIENFETYAKCGDVTGPAARIAAEIILEPTETFEQETNARIEEIVNIRQLMKKKSGQKSPSNLKL